MGRVLSDLGRVFEAGIRESTITMLHINDCSLVTCLLGVASRGNNKIIGYIYLPSITKLNVAYLVRHWEILTTELCYKDSVFLGLFRGRKAIQCKG